MRQKITLLAIGIAIITIVGCKKSKENNIIGTWRQMDFQVPDSTKNICRWSFYADKTVAARIYDPKDHLLTEVNGDYSIFRKKFKLRLQIARDSLRFDVNQIDYRGNYVIEIVSRDVLRLVRVEGYNDEGEWCEGGSIFAQLEFLKE